MNPCIRIVIVSISFLLSLACVTIMGGGAENTNNDVPAPAYPNDRAPQVEQPATEAPAAQQANSCPVITNKIIALAESGGVDDSANLLDNEVTLVTYDVNGNEISNPHYENVRSSLKSQQKDEATQLQVWNYFSALIPLNMRSDLSEYSIITDGQGGTLAAVSQTDTDPDLWSLQVDPADAGNYYDSTYTLIHEFAHLLTLGADQVPPSIAVFNNPDNDNIYFKEVAACPNYFPGEGCARPKSYINAFYNQFWTDIYDEWNKINLIENDGAYYKKLDDFYYKYQDQFVTSYAPTNPEEDIAESFAFFVFSPQPDGNSIAEQKMLFFYQYPELVQLRTEILNNTCASFPE